MKINLETSSDDARIEIIPLIDVIFCILTFFLLAALQLTRQQAINVDLPKAATGSLQQRELLMVSLDSAGRTYIDRQPVTADELYQRMVGYLQVKPNGRVVLYAPKTALYNNVVQVLDLLRSVGGDRVALATLPEGSETPATGNPNTLSNTGQPGFTDPGAAITNPGTLPPSGDQLTAPPAPNTLPSP